MTDVFTAEKRSQVMRQVKGRDTRPELKDETALKARLAAAVRRS